MPIKTYTLKRMQRGALDEKFKSDCSRNMRFLLMACGIRHGLIERPYIMESDLILFMMKQDWNIH